MRSAPPRSAASKATFSICAITAAACSTRRSISRAWSIHQGPIVSTIDRAGDRDERDATGAAIDPLPLVVLVNKYTASASEITAGALQDDHLATIVGTKTFGKGVVQSLYTLPDRGALKITTARYVTPNGRDIQHKGIMPDVVVDQRVDIPIIATKADKQLAAAESILRRKDVK